jgi:hypothetical protein
MRADLKARNGQSISGPLDGTAPVAGREFGLVAQFLGDGRGMRLSLGLRWRVLAIAVAVSTRTGWGQDTRTVTEPVFPASCSVLQAQLSIVSGEPSSETAFDIEHLGLRQQQPGGAESGHASSRHTVCQRYGYDNYPCGNCHADGAGHGEHHELRSVRKLEEFVEELL